MLRFLLQVNSVQISHNEKPQKKLTFLRRYCVLVYGDWSTTRWRPELHFGFCLWRLGHNKMAAGISFWFLLVATGAQQDGVRHFVSLSTANRKCDNNWKHIAVVHGNINMGMDSAKMFIIYTGWHRYTHGQEGSNPPPPQPPPEKKKSWVKIPLQML